jgi:hypothetical protein
MTKILDTYRGYTASELKSRSSIPSAGNITENATSISCNELSLDAIRTLLSVSGYDVTSIFNSTNLNMWSAFAPVSRTVVDNVITNSYKTSESIEDFAGYNHTAMTPGWNNYEAATANINIIEGGTCTFSIDVNIGEVDYSTIPSAGIVGVMLMVVEAGSTDVVAYGFTSIENATEIINIQGTTGSLSHEHSYDQYIYFANEIAPLTPEELLTPYLTLTSRIACEVPNITSYARCTTVILEQFYLNLLGSWNVYGTNDPAEATINYISNNVQFTSIISKDADANPCIFGAYLLDVANNTTIGIVECDLSPYFSGDMASPIFPVFKDIDDVTIDLGDYQGVYGYRIDLICP